MKCWLTQTPLRHKISLVTPRERKEEREGEGGWIHGSSLRITKTGAQDGAKQRLGSQETEQVMESSWPKETTEQGSVVKVWSSAYHLQSACLCAPWWWSSHHRVAFPEECVLTNNCQEQLEEMASPRHCSHSPTSSSCKGHQWCSCARDTFSPYFLDLMVTSSLLKNSQFRWIQWLHTLFFFSPCFLIISRSLFLTSSPLLHLRFP